MAIPAQTQQSIDLRIAHLEQELLELKRQRNGLSPIMAIPPELLCQILLLATTRNDNPIELMNLPEIRVKRFIGTLCHVSHSWRMTALGSPQLWAAIDVRMGTDGRLVEFMLDHAQTLPISFHINAKTPNWNYNQLEALVPIARMLSAGVPLESLSLDGELGFLAVLLQGARPETLRALGIIVSDGAGETTLGYTLAGLLIAQAPLFTSGVPELRVLSLRRCAIPLTSPILLQSPHITSLRLCISRASSAAQLTDMFRAIGQVELIHLDFTYTLQGPDSLGPVHLPHLRSVTLRGDAGSANITILNLRLSAKIVTFDLLCSAHNPQHFPLHGVALFKAIGQARCSPERIRGSQPSDEPFSPEFLDIGKKDPAGLSDGVCYLRTGNWKGSGGVTSEALSNHISIAFGDHNTSSYVNWSVWQPMVLAKQPRDLQLKTGWSMDRLTTVAFIDEDAEYPGLFWEFLSKCPKIYEVVIAPTHISRLLFHLSADNGGIPFPYIGQLVVQGAISRELATSSSTVEQKCRVGLLLQSLRMRQRLCMKYGNDKEWMLNLLWLDIYVASPDPLLVHTAHAEGLVKCISSGNQVYEH